MARYTGPKVRQYRALGIAEFSGKKAGLRRPFRPGMHGQARQKLSEYAIRLKEKQKARVIYGVLEKQFRRYYDKAASTRGVTGEVLLQLLERRLDNVVYRLGLAETRPQARQFVNHGHFEVNGVRVDVPSYRVEQYDIITVRGKSVNTFPIELARQTFGERPVPAWMQVVPGSLQILIHQLPVRAQIDTILTEQLIVELYSKN